METLRLLLPFLLLMLVILLPLRAFGGGVVRPPAWAGSFYPADAEQLRRQLAEYCRVELGEPESNDSKGEEARSGRKLRALVLPHAGYSYSGKVAGTSARVLKEAGYRRVVLIGPDHNVGFYGGAISDAAFYQTPLGRIPVDPAAAELRRRYSFFNANSLSDQKEHSLEVILPFLQYLIGEFQLVPIVLGPADMGEVARAIEPLLDDETLLVISTDLSHFLSDSEARHLDSTTVKGLLELDPQVLQHRNSACGRYGLELLLELAVGGGWQPELLSYMNSSETGGDPYRVVGYAAMAFFAPAQTGTETAKQSGLNDSQGQLLVSLARNVIAGELGLEEEPLPEFGATLLTDPELRREGAAFVTLNRQGQLRGCIGSIVPTRPLIDDIRANARNAAFHDPRFSPLKPEEFRDVDIEVSVLTPPVSLEYTDADDLLRRIRPHVDGVILADGYRSATYLPQVWDQIPDPEQFLSYLCAKAGLERDAWRKRKLEVKVYQVQHFSRKAVRD